MYRDLYNYTCTVRDVYIYMYISVWILHLIISNHYNTSIGLTSGHLGRIMTLKLGEVGIGWGPDLYCTQDNDF